MWRVLVASATPAMRAGLSVLLDASDDVYVAAEAGTGDELLRAAEATHPDAVVFDLDLETGIHLNALWRLRHSFPRLPVLVLSNADDDARILPALQAGARGFLPRTAEAPDLIESVCTVAAGGSAMPLAATEALLDRLRGEAPGESLTPREVQVLEGVSAGLTNKAIAQRLGISEHTVKFHLGSVMSKLAAASRAEAVTIAIRRGLISV